MSETWTYFDANTIQIAGDSSAYYWPNMLLKITQSTEKFFVVLAVAVVGGNTRLTISGGGVYTLTNAAITVHAATKNAGEQGIPSGFLEQGLAYGAATKSTPADADGISLWDSAANFGRKRLTWANLKATLKTYFDSIYSLTGHGHTSLGEIDTRYTNPTPQSYSMGERFDFKANTADGLADGGTFHGVMTYRRWGDWSGGGVSQLAFTDNGNLWIRYANADDTWGSWKLVSLQSLATAQNDFLVGSGAGAFVKKTLAEVKTILGLGSAAYTPATAYVTHALATAANDFLVASGSGVFVKKTLAEVKTILGLGTAAYTAATDYAIATKGVTNGDSHDHAGGDGAQIDHGSLGGLGDDDHTGYLRLAGRGTYQTIWNNILIEGNDGFNASGESATLYIGDTNLFLQAVWGFGLKIGTYNAANCFTLAQETGNVYILGNCSAASFTDRTEAFIGDALAAIARIKADENGNIIHSTLPEFAINPYQDENDEWWAGRDIGNMVSVLTAGMQQLIAENTELKARLEKLEEKKVNA